MFRKRWKTVLLYIILSVICVITTACAETASDNEYQINIQLNGDRNVDIEYNAEFTDPGASATMLDKTSGIAEPATVTVTGSVNTKKLGTYTLRYMVSWEGTIGTAYRRVQVVDTQLPVITLVSDPERYTLPGQPYEEEGFTAIDNHDGDITDQVKREEKDGIVTYIVSDSSGNRATVTRQILYKDPLPPELTLKGEKMIIIEQGAEYTEPGYTATDNCDGDLTASVKISGSVNTFQSGKYTLTYTVADTFKNTVQKTRTVFVKEPAVKNVNNPTKGDKFIYLTFDDGPGPHTDRLLDILKKYNVQATFFVVNTGYIDRIARASSEGHTVAIHTLTHNFKQIYANEDAFFNDLYKMQEIIKAHTGKATNLMRFPGGSSNTISSSNKGLMTRLTKLVEDVGFVYFDWNVDSMDAGGARTSKKVFQNVTKGVSRNTESVVLMHDIKSYTVDAIESIIVWGLKNGYTFLPLSAGSPTCHHRVNN